jgi:hypothetical protein
MTQVSYLASFQKIHRPILLVVERYEMDGAIQGYRIAEGLIMSIVIEIGLPVLLFALSLYMVVKRPAMLNDPSP